MNAETMLNGLEAFTDAIEQRQVAERIRALRGAIAEHVKHHNPSTYQGLISSHDHLAKALGSTHRVASTLRGGSAMVFAELAKGMVDHDTISQLSAAISNNADPKAIQQNITHILGRFDSNLRAYSTTLSALSGALDIDPDRESRPNPEDMHLIEFYLPESTGSGTLRGLEEALQDISLILKELGHLAPGLRRDAPICTVHNGSISIVMGIAVAGVSLLVGAYKLATSVAEHQMKLRMHRLQIESMRLDFAKKYADLMQEDQSHVRLATDAANDLIESTRGTPLFTDNPETRGAVKNAILQLAKMQEKGLRLLPPPQSFVEDEGNDLSTTDGAGLASSLVVSNRQLDTAFLPLRDQLLLAAGDDEESNEDEEKADNEGEAEDGNGASAGNGGDDHAPDHDGEISHDAGEEEDD